MPQASVRAWPAVCPSDGTGVAAADGALLGETDGAVGGAPLGALDAAVDGTADAADGLDVAVPAHPPATRAAMRIAAGPRIRGGRVDRHRRDATLDRPAAAQLRSRRHDDDEDRLRGDARAVPPDRPARLVRGRPRAPASRPGSWSASTSTRGRPQQGQSAFAWAFMGALGPRTSLPFGTAVTCPGFRYHPAVIAHAAATLGAMYPGPLLARARRRRGAQRARHRRRVAGGRRPQRDDVRVDRDHQASCSAGEVVKPPRQALHAREREALHPPRRRLSRSTSPRPDRSTPRRPASSPTG